MCKWATRLFTKWATKIVQEAYSGVRDEEGERTVDDISIVGSNRFRDQVTESINHLRRHYAFGYSLVQRYIRGIVALPKPIDFGFVDGLYFEIPQSNGGLPWSPDRFAALLVRDAIFARESKYDLWVFRNARVQLVAWKAELRCMKLLGCHPDYVKQQEDFIAAKIRKAQGITSYFFGRRMRQPIAGFRPMKH
jgi:hypothetical protein